MRGSLFPEERSSLVAKGGDKKEILSLPHAAMQDGTVVPLGLGGIWAHRVPRGGIAQHLPQPDKGAFKQENG